MKDWTFKEGFAGKFDSHVREQLPWYELVTESVAYIARNYLPKQGLVYDIGCSTGNMTLALKDLLIERNAKIIALDESDEMCKAYRFNTDYRYEVRSCDAMQHEYKSFDVAILMLTTMFFPVIGQEAFIESLYQKMNKGGAIIVVDKVCDEEGYFSTVMKRLTMYWKLKNGAKPEDILSKELSLSGIQRPIKMPKNAKQFFQLGEFKGWVIEK
jgi:tRNA (cmo5U34)-methyltransferase